MIVYLFQMILELFALNNVTLFLCWMWPAAEPLLRKGKHTHTNTHQELAQSKRGFCGLYVGTRAKAAEHGYGVRDLAVPGVGRAASKDFLSRASLRQTFWSWVLSKKLLRAVYQKPGKESHFIERSLAICFPQKMGPISCLLRGQEAGSPEFWLV